jgi:hypothetical protein
MTAAAAPPAERPATKTRFGIRAIEAAGQGAVRKLSEWSSGFVGSIDAASVF